MDVERIFPADFDDEFDVGPRDGDRAYFGRNVLHGLVEGIVDFIALKQPRWKSWHSIGPVLLGSAMWIDDRELMDKIAQLEGACVVVPKQSRDVSEHWKLQRLAELNERAPGIPTGAFRELEGKLPRVNGAPVVIGPYDKMNTTVPTIRTIGYRKFIAFPPIIHAKLALLGQLWWSDEHPSGAIVETLGFSPRRLWISSANFTFASRRSLEFGFWTEDEALLAGAQRFLLKLIRNSEELDPSADALAPQPADVEFDDEAMAEAMADFSWKCEASD